MFQELFPILSTGDLPRALGFYRDLLGFEVTYRFPADGDPAYVALDLGRSHLGIGADPAGNRVIVASRG
jgi:lactoylglutathione lyase